MLVAQPKLGSSISFHDVSYYMRTYKYGIFPKGQSTILNNLTGIFRPGLNVIVGPTGCGKTTFLDVLAGRTDPSLTAGRIFIDGNERPDNFKRCSCYVSQENFAMDSLTVRENLYFSAALRLPSNVSRKERDARVAALIKKLGLSAVADVKVGSELIRGISGGERKRTNIGIELITDPPVIFLDEPTTGLDTYTASKLMKLLKRLTAEGKTIIASIHQPNWSIYKLFDSVTLLCNGRAIYHGPAGESPLKYFCDLGYKISTHENPADFFMDLLHQDLPFEARSRLGLPLEGEPEETNEIESAEDADEINRLAISLTRICHLQQLFVASTEWSSWISEAQLIFSSWCSTRKRFSKMSQECSSTKFHSVSGSEAELSPLMTSTNFPKSSTSNTALSPSGNQDIQSIPRIDSASLSDDAFVFYINSRKSPSEFSERREFDTEKGSFSNFEPIPFYRQFAVLASRGFLNTIRNPKATAVPFAGVAVFTMILGAVYYQLGSSSEAGLQDRTGLFFFLCLELAYFNGNAVDIFIRDRPKFRHERACGFYRTSMYFLAKLLCEVIPIKLGPILFFFPILYAMTGLRRSFAAMFFFETTCLCMGTAAAGITMFSIILVDHVSLGYAIAGIILSFMMSFGGFLLNVVSAWWLGWCRYLSIFWYAYSSLSINEIHGATYCPTSININPKFLTSPFSHGNFSRTICINGNDFLMSKGIVFEPTWQIWINPLALAVFSCAVYFLCYVRLRLTKLY
nr:ATP binding cassette sub family G [Hymenolepis microstoma]